MPRAVPRLLLLACLVLPALPASAAPLRVVMDQNYPSDAYRISEGKLEGCPVDLWRLSQQKTGTPVEIIPANRAQALPMQEGGQADVVDPARHPGRHRLRLHPKATCIRRPSHARPSSSFWNGRWCTDNITTKETT